MRVPGRTVLFSLIFITGLIFLILSLFTKPEDKNVKGVSNSSYDNQVAQVIDGDTFTLENGEKVRLIGINAPENGQPYFNESKSLLESLLLSKAVKLITDTQVQDQYGRILAYVYTDTDVDINLEMIKNGLAVTETIPPNVSRSDIFFKAQREARNSCLGIWEGLCDNSNLCVQISEIQPKSQDGTKNGEWIEFINTCSIPYLLKGYLLKDNSASNKYEFGNIILQPKKKIRLYSGCGEDSESSLYWRCPENSSYIWNDNSDRAYLFNKSGRLISELGY